MSELFTLIRSGLCQSFSFLSEVVYVNNMSLHHFIGLTAKTFSVSGPSMEVLKAGSCGSSNDRHQHTPALTSDNP